MEDYVKINCSGILFFHYSKRLNRVKKKKKRVVKLLAHRAGHFEGQGGGLHPPYPRSAFISSYRAGYSMEFS